MQVLSINLDEELMDRLDAVAGQLELNQLQLLQDAVLEKVQELEEMASVMDLLNHEGSSKSQAAELLEALERNAPAYKS